MKVYHSLRELSKRIDSQVQVPAVKQAPIPKFDLGFQGKDWIITHKPRCTDIRSLLYWSGVTGQIYICWSTSRLLHGPCTWILFLWKLHEEDSKFLAYVQVLCFMQSFRSREGRALFSISLMTSCWNQEFHSSCWPTIYDGEIWSNNDFHKKHALAEPSFIALEGKDLRFEWGPRKGHFRACSLYSDVGKQHHLILLLKVKSCKSSQNQCLLAR